MNAGLLAANSPGFGAAMSAAPTAMETAMSMGGKALGGLAKANAAMGTAKTAMDVMSPQAPQPAPPPPPRPAQVQPPSFGGYGALGGDDPQLVAEARRRGITVEQLKQMMSQRGMQP
jgi:hypothetical protein